MKGSLRLLFVAAVAAVSIQAQPKVDQGGVLNSASYALDGGPSEGVARGGLIVIFGQNLGPQTLQAITAFPLPLTLPAGNGTSVRVSAGGGVYNCPMIYTSARQVAAILPSATPAGAGKLRVTYNGQTSNEVDIKIVDHSFGIYTQTANGMGQAAIQNFVSPTSMPLNTMWASAMPDSIGILWGTGLGPVPWDETGPPQATDFSGVDVRVWVGSQQAQIEYKGRSGSCAGLDQINFRVPRGVLGCQVPVAVQIGNRVSNIGTISISENGGQCPELAGLADAVRPSASGASRTARVGTIVLSRSRATVIGISGAHESSTLDGVSAGFTAIPVTAGVIPALQTFSGLPPLSLLAPVGTCTVTLASGSSGGAMTMASKGDSHSASSAALSGLDAGDRLTVTGPRGTKDIPRVMLFDTWFPRGFYARTFGQFDTGTMAPSPLFVDPGAYTISAPGGTGEGAVGQFTANVTMPGEVVWTNMQQVGPINRAQGQVVTWEGGDPDGVVVITGTSVNPAFTVLGNLACFERVSAHRFTIPAYVLLSMPAGEAGPLLPFPNLAVNGMTNPRTFTATGLELGTVSGVSVSAKVLSYR